VENEMLLPQNILPNLAKILSNFLNNFAIIDVIAFFLTYHTTIVTEAAVSLYL